MSTRSCIIVHVKDEDLKKIKKFNPTILPLPQNNWDFLEEADKDKCGKITLNKPYIGIYCHYDGYIEGVGLALKEKFNDYKTALNLIIGGDCSFVSLDGIRRYSTRRCEEWKYIKPSRGMTPKEIYGNYIDHEYCYLFENGEWKVKSIGDKDFKEYECTD